MKRLVLLMFALLVAGFAGAVEWSHLDADHHLAGRKTSNGYLRGKVVLVCRWEPNVPTSCQMLTRLEDVWQSFKNKPFVILATCSDDATTVAAAKNLLSETTVTFPVYAGAELAMNHPQSEKHPFLFVVDETGKIVYRGREDRSATQAIVMALTDMEAPRNLAQWQRFLDCELENQPGRASLRAAEFRKKFPVEAKEYADKFKVLSARADVKKVTELVAFARKAKDMRAFDPKKEVQKKKFKSMVERAITKYASLTESSDALVAQEAKNALADLKWTLAAL